MSLLAGVIEGAERVLVLVGQRSGGGLDDEASKAFLIFVEGRSRVSEEGCLWNGCGNDRFQPAICDRVGGDAWVKIGASRSLCACSEDMVEHWYYACPRV